VINGKGLGGGYDGGRWLLDIRVPDGSSSGSGQNRGSYPNAPPVVRFVTRICAANVGFEVYVFLFWDPFDPNVPGSL
jgi:peroxin-4